VLAEKLNTAESINHQRLRSNLLYSDTYLQFM